MDCKLSLVKDFAGFVSKEQVADALADIKINNPSELDGTTIDFIAGFGAALMMLAESEECRTFLRVSDYVKVQLLDYQMKLMVEAMSKYGVFADMGLTMEGDACNA